VRTRGQASPCGAAGRVSRFGNKCQVANRGEAFIAPGQALGEVAAPRAPPSQQLRRLPRPGGRGARLHGTLLHDACIVPEDRSPSGKTPARPVAVNFLVVAVWGVLLRCCVLMSLLEHCQHCLSIPAVDGAKDSRCRFHFPPSSPFGTPHKWEFHRSRSPSISTCWIGKGCDTDEVVEEDEESALPDLFEIFSRAISPSLPTFTIPSSQRGKDVGRTPGPLPRSRRPLARAGRRTQPGSHQ
jgi:hypothetical protein